jgi:ATP-dependent RNA helicase DeaD
LYLCSSFKDISLSKFKDLGLSATTVEVLDKLGFTQPTPIQQEAIPILLKNDPTDFIGLAQTGTGKTAAFGLPLIELIRMEDKVTQALILAPTRELSQQTAKQLTDFSYGHKSLQVEVVYGGAAITNQIKALKKTVQIVVATPGRLLDLVKRKAVNLSNIRYIILDEADEMLNMGFKEDIDTILSYMGEEKSTWLFSATMPSDIRKIVKKYMVNPQEVSVNTKEITNVDISHKYVITKTANKVPAIRRFLDSMPEMRGIMFCRTRRETQQIAEDLSAQGYGVEALHGDLSQAQRDAVMRRFKSRSMQLLIATDVAARGIDVNDLTHVMHHTLPDQQEYYTHRSGRTGRAGKKGISLAFINPREGRRITEIEKRLKIKFEIVEVPSIEELKSSRINNWANLIINTKVDEQSEEILSHLHGQFAHLSKEDLLKRLITTQLDHLLMQSGEDQDLNEIHGGNQAKRGESKQKREGYNRYFINIGSIDGVTKADLLHFLSDVSEINRKAFGDIDLQKNCAFFEIEASKDAQLAPSFVGIQVEGREIRVNLENDAEIKSRSKGKKYGGGGGSRSRGDRRPRRDNSKYNSGRNRRR